MRLTAGALVLAVSACGTADNGIPAAADPTDAAREVMVAEQIAARGIADPLVLDAMRRVPRHLFVPEEHRSWAYADRPLPIGLGQTISQPYIVAMMTEALGLRGGEKVLEIGCGSGYQAAVLGEIVAEVHTIEILEELGRRGERTLRELGYDNVRVHIGDGYLGLPEEAPFDAILVAAAPDHVPPALVEQLRVGGRLIIPVGDRRQELLLIEKTGSGTRRRSLLPVLFVPMTGEAQER